MARIPARAIAILTVVASLVALVVGGTAASTVGKSLARPSICDPGRCTTWRGMLQHIDVLDRGGVERELRAAVVSPSWR